MKTLLTATVISLLTVTTGFAAPVSKSDFIDGAATLFIITKYCDGCSKYQSNYEKTMMIAAPATLGVDAVTAGYIIGRRARELYGEDKHCDMLLANAKRIYKH